MLDKILLGNENEKELFSGVRVCSSQFLAQFRLHLLSIVEKNTLYPNISGSSPSSRETIGPNFIPKY